MTNAATQREGKAKTWPSYLMDHAIPRNGVFPRLTITAPAQYVLRKPAPLAMCKCPTFVGKKSAKERSQFYTRCDLAKRYYLIFLTYFDPADFQMVEPSAGYGAFLDHLPDGAFGCDLEPMTAGIYTVDFLKAQLKGSRPIACIGNPPFGKNAQLAISFFNHAALQADVIAFILPRTFCKAATINRLDDRFHLLHEEPVPDNAFLFEGKPRSVPTVFQIWARREIRRPRLPAIKTHPDFKFTSRGHADFAIQRVGNRAGRVHDQLWRSHEAHYFIQGNVKKIMKELEPVFTIAARNTAGNPSLAMSEIVSIYNEHASRSLPTPGA